MVKEAHGTYRIADLAENDRPRERLALLGAEQLEKAELMAILLRVGVEGKSAIQLGDEILRTMGGLLGIQKASIADLCSVNGVGPAKAAQIKAAIELGRRLALDSPQSQEAISTPGQAADLVRYEMQALAEENLWVILLDIRNHKIDIEKLYKGSVTTSQVRIGELFSKAVLKKAASIIIVHNHPSGDPSPSPEDVALTKGAVQAGKLLDIEVLDHLVIGAGTFVSLKEKGLGFA